ncbi:MAG TPA: hypothetical protein DIT39_05370 [Tissierellales bacterium]|jgi:predicted transcriptional regulator|uniref:DUF4364 family protein n=1 Tax=Gudongella oleilytica TaxID=1582259 RepID=UPI000ECEE769|nr:DUF4364 family protein [Gudongella oleilytica]MDY0257527.1 DUF4364 family protein [Gudongella oleilytica]HCO19021.1 hypothetical protein [Tissierellales bacterium]HMM69241.1 DUF4364 family protein [Gudongella oleilytica]
MFQGMSEDTALQRLILLKITSSSMSNITNTKISEAAIENFDMNFFQVQQHLSELTESGFLASSKFGGEVTYSITDAGDSILELFKDKLSDQISSLVESLFITSGQLQGADASYFLSETGEYSVDLVLTERGLTIFRLTLSIPDEIQAKKICSNWKLEPSNIFGKIMKIIDPV